MDPLPMAEDVLGPPAKCVKVDYISRYLEEGAYPPSFSRLKKWRLRCICEKYILEGGCLYYVGQNKDEKREVVVEPERKRLIFLKNHLTEVGHHHGMKKTMQKIQIRYYWRGILKDVQNLVKRCETCQDVEHSKNLYRNSSPVKAESPWEVLRLELLGPFLETTQENAYVLTITDYFTEWIEAIPLQKKDAISVAKELHSTFCRFGASKTIYFHQSRNFCDEVSRHLYEKWNISQAVTSADEFRDLDNPSNQLLRASIRSMVAEKQIDWDNFLEPILFEFRTAMNPITKYTPFFLMYKREARLFSKVIADKNAASKEERKSIKRKAKSQLKDKARRKDRSQLKDKSLGHF